MKYSMVLSASTLALTAFAEPMNAQRDVNVATNVLDQISSAIIKLDASVKAFDGDAAQVQKNADKLVAALKTGTNKITAAGEISITDAMGLQEDVQALGTAGLTLMQDLESKKGKFEAAGLCVQAGSLVKSVGNTVQSLVNGVITQLPLSIQDMAQEQTGQLTDILTKGLSTFNAQSCKDAVAGASSSAAALAARETTSCTEEAVSTTPAVVSTPPAALTTPPATTAQTSAVPSSPVASESTSCTEEESVSVPPAPVSTPPSSVSVPPAPATTAQTSAVPSFPVPSSPVASESTSCTEEESVSVPPAPVSTPPATTARTSAVPSFPIPSTTLVRSSSVPPAVPALSTGVLPTGSLVPQPSSMYPIPTAAAVANGAAPFGVAAGLVAALML